MTRKQLNILYKAMIPEVKGPATMKYILALRTRVSELEIENDSMRAAKGFQPKGDE